MDWQFPDLTGLEIFPAPESNTLEFKLSLSNIIKSNCPRTFCSFLNSKGGYIVFGVEDKERRIVGINVSSAELDEYLLWFDSFYQARRIIDSNGNPLAPGTIDVRIVNVTTSKFVIVAHIKPEPGMTYKCNDGTAWYRLAASAYSFQEGSSEKEIARLKVELKQEQERRVICQNEVQYLRDDMKRLIGVAKQIDERLQTFGKDVENDILLRKTSVEKYLGSRNRWLSYLFCKC
jgi:predicted HTH transcriptional regulator